MKRYTINLEFISKSCTNKRKKICMKSTAKRLLLGLVMMVCLIVLMAICVGAEDVTYSEGLEFTSNGDGTCSVSIGSCTETEIFIPEVSPEGDKVTSIKSGAFYNCVNLTSIVIPNSVNSIESGAFYGCKQLFQKENGVSYIDKWAVSFDRSETTVSLRRNTVGIADSAFEYCSDLIGVRIPNSVTSIGDTSFYSCYNLRNITIPNNLTIIGNGAFSSCRSLTDFNLPDSLSSIGRNAFSGCERLVQIEDGVHYVDKWVVGCDKSINSVTIRSNAVGIANSAFESCEFLYDVTIGDSVISIGDSAFCGCERLVSIDFGDNLVSIGNNAFRGCEELYADSVVFPEGLTHIGNSAFYGCDRLTRITIPHNVKFLGDNVFSSCENLSYVNIGNSVTHIGEQAFSGCKNLERIAMSNSIISIGNYAFFDCEDLTSIIIPNSVTDIGEGAFENCGFLQSIVVQEGNLFYYSIENCLIDTKTKTLIRGCNNSVIPADGSVTKIGGSAFSGCWSLRSIVIPDGMTSIGDKAFYNCKNLTNIIIPNSVTSIGNSAFYNCSSLKSVNIPFGVTDIGYYTFFACEGISSFVIPGSVTNIGSGAFAACSYLTFIMIPNSVTNIDYGAFSGCKGLKQAIYLGSFEKWSKDVIVASSNENLLSILEFHAEHTADSPATCTKDQVCTVCGAIIAEKGHIYISEVVQPSCTKSGYVIHNCSRCGESYTDSETPATGHTPGDWITDIEPAVGVEGHCQQSCTVCNKVLNEETIPALPEETEPETEPETESETEPETEPETDPITEPESEPETDPVTEAPTEAPSDDSATTEEPTAEELSTTPTITVGCSGSILSCGLLMLIALAGAALIKRKE